MANFEKQAEFESYVYGVIKRFVPILLMDKHIWLLHFGVEDKDSLMECVYNYPYLNVTINYGEKVVQKWERGEDIIPFIVHEMCHPITDPLYSKATTRYVSRDEINDEREGLTDYICNIALRKAEK